jgi:hypothetical protein
MPPDRHWGHLLHARALERIERLDRLLRLARADREALIDRRLDGIGPAPEPKR